MAPNPQSRGNLVESLRVQDGTFAAYGVLGEPDDPVDPDLARAAFPVPRSAADVDPYLMPVVVSVAEVHVLARQHQDQQPRPITADHKRGSVLATAVVVLVWDPAPDHFARIWLTIRLRRVADVEDADIITRITGFRCWDARRARHPSRAR